MKLLMQKGKGRDKKMLDMKELLAFSVEERASDVHIAVGIPPKLRINGKLTEVEVPLLHRLTQPRQ